VKNEEEAFSGINRIHTVADYIKIAAMNIEEHDKILLKELKRKTLNLTTIVCE